MADPRLLLLLAAAVAAVAGLAVFMEWRRNRAADALVWCATALAAAALAFILFAVGGDVPDAPPRMLGNYLTLAGAGALLCGASRLNGRPPSWLALVLGPTIWLAFSARIGPDFSWRVVVMSTLHGCYALATAFELVRNRRGRSRTIYLPSGVIVGFGLLHLLRAATGANFMARQAVSASLNGGWVLLVAGGSIFYIVLLAATFVYAVRRDGQLPNIASNASPQPRARIEP